MTETTSTPLADEAQAAPEGLQKPAAPKPPAAAQQTDRLGTERIGKLLFEFSVPAIVSMVFNTLYNVVDTVFLGQAYADGSGVAVTTLALPVMTILMGFSMIAGQGGNALAAIQLGQGKKDQVEKTLGNSATLLVGIAVAIALVAGVLIDPILAGIGTTDELWSKTKTFIQIICFGFVFQSLGMGLNNFLRTAGKPNLALGTMVFGTVMCIALNFLFVIVLGFGVAGSASATILGQACGMVPVVWHFTLSKNAAFKLRLRCCKPDFRLMKSILTLGIASFVMQVAATFVGIVLNHVVNRYGATDPIGTTAALAAIGVAQKATSFAFTPLIGLIMGAQPIIGFNYGAKLWQRVLDTLKWASVTGACIGGFFFLLVQLIPVPIVSLFGVSGDLEDFAVFALRVYVIFLAPVGFQIVGASYFQSSGQPLKAAILEMTRQIIMLIPLYLFLPDALTALFGLTGLQGVVICVPVSDALSVCVTTCFVIREVRKLRRWRDGKEIA